MFSCGATWQPARTWCGPDRLVALSAQAESFDQRAVALDLVVPQVTEQPAALADQQQQAPAGVVVMLMGLEVFGQVGDPLGQQRDLDLRGAGVALVGGVV